jgi:hypothetical protein
MTFDHTQELRKFNTAIQRIEEIKVLKQTQQVSLHYLSKNVRFQPAEGIETRYVFKQVIAFAPHIAGPQLRHPCREDQVSHVAIKRLMLCRVDSCTTKKYDPAGISTRHIGYHMVHYLMLHADTYECAT